jgi:hypothetical protein
VNKDYRASVSGHTANTNVCRASAHKRTANIVETVRKCLPCAVRKMHGKERLYRAPDKKRTANIITHGKYAFSRSDNNAARHQHVR